MIRYPDWPTRLAEYFKACADRPLEYGAFDCALFACGALHAMTGIHPLKRYIGKYDTPISAARQMKLYSGGGLAETAEKASRSIGLKPVEPAFAKRGDMALAHHKGVHFWGVVDLDGRNVRCVGYNSAEQSDSVGTTHVPINTIVSVWSFN